MVLIKMDNEDLKQFVDGLDKLMDKHANDLQELMDYILEDLIDSYDALIQQREQAINKYIKFITFIMQDERDINKPIQALMDKKHLDVAELEQEVAPIKTFKDLLFAENPSEDEMQDAMATIKNIYQ